MHFRQVMKYLRTILSRIRAWWTRRTSGAGAQLSLALTFGPPIYRDVTPRGVRVYSLCGGCGARLECSATLCQECAQGPHTSAF
jgi:hypothetical protein